MHRRPVRRWARLVSTILGLTSLACCCAGAQRNPLADLPPTPISPLDLSTGLSANTDIPAITAINKEALPDAPAPNIEVTAPDGNPGGNPPRNNDRNNSDATPAGAGGTPQQTSPGFPPVSPTPRHLPPSPVEHPSIPSVPAPCQTGGSTSTPANISCGQDVDYFQRFVDSGIHPLTPRQKGKLAFRNTVDPYNFATIAVFSAISVASDPNSAYGPGVPGFGRNFGVAYCETAVGEFFGTFLIPSIAHQDPHYHRMPNASYVRRALHTVTAVVWAQSDYGAGMPNYSTLITTAVGDGLGNLYVPGRDKSWGSAAARYTTAIATDPLGNIITEFVPDVARRVNVHIVLLQQIVNHVEKNP
jgi:hypothetical protein